MSINKVTIVGNLGANPETKVFQDGNSITNITVYTEEKWNDANGQPQKDTQTHRVVFRGGIAKIASKYLKSGSKVYIEGKLKTRSYEQEGVTKWVTEIVVAGFQGVLQMLDKAPVQQMATSNEIPMELPTDNKPPF